MVIFDLAAIVSLRHAEKRFNKEEKNLTIERKHERTEIAKSRKGLSISKPAGSG
jgi:hypothetical protein